VFPQTVGRALLFLLGFWLALAVVGPLVHPRTARGDPGAEQGDVSLAQTEAALHEDVNRVRAEQHMVPLLRMPELDRAARRHSQDMAARRYLAHETPEGRNPVHRIQREGVDGFTLAAENAGSTSRPDPNREILTGWLTSPVHRKNLFMPAFNATGIGVARAEDGTLYYTQVYVTFPRGSGQGAPQP
jgi:uncharacterized protein YkwD